MDTSKKEYYVTDFTVKIVVVDILVVLSKNEFIAGLAAQFKEAKCCGTEHPMLARKNMP